MAKAVSMNVASRSSDPNGRGRININDTTFEYLPIPEGKETVNDIPTYSELEWIEKENLKKSNLPVHLDPEFKTYTYGHIKRGFGDVSSILDLEKGDYFFFHSTLADLEDSNKWLTAIIGYLEVKKIVDCRDLSSSEIKAINGFENNAHLKRKEPNVDFLVSGTEDSKLLERCIPLSSLKSPRCLKEDSEELIRTPTGKKINGGSPWFRWTLKILEPEKILKRVERNG